MRIATPTETAQSERRVALTPEGVKELCSLGAEVFVQAGAGQRSFFSDGDYAESGAQIRSDLDFVAESDIVLRVNSPTIGEVQCLKPGSVHVSFLWPAQNPDVISAMAARSVTAFAMDRMPRITRAQSMDALSSMSTIAGYKAALVCADALPRFLPMLMTAAGTIPPSRIFVIGAGVAGLQAIATSKRLGAIVEAFDVRPAVKEQIESLGAKFVGLPEIQVEEKAGYATEMSADQHMRELELIAKKLPQVDGVITTALIPGKPAPILITNAMLASMKPGSVLVDLAAANGGNCEATMPGEVIVKNEVTIIGRTDLVTSMGADASKMYSKNITSFLKLLIQDGKICIDTEDEIVSETLVTPGGVSK